LVSPIGERSALGTLVWKMLGRDGGLIREWRQSRNLVRVATGWQILVSTFHLPSATPASGGVQLAAPDRLIESGRSQTTASV